MLVKSKVCGLSRPIRGTRGLINRTGSDWCAQKSIFLSFRTCITPLKPHRKQICICQPRVGVKSWELLSTPSEGWESLNLSRNLPVNPVRILIFSSRLPVNGDAVICSRNGRIRPQRFRYSSALPGGGPVIFQESRITQCYKEKEGFSGLFQSRMRSMVLQRKSVDFSGTAPFTIQIRGPGFCSNLFNHRLNLPTVPILSGC